MQGNQDACILHWANNIPIALRKCQKCPAFLLFAIAKHTHKIRVGKCVFFNLFFHLSRKHRPRQQRWWVPCSNCVFIIATVKGYTTIPQAPAIFSPQAALDTVKWLYALLNQSLHEFLYIKGTEIMMLTQALANPRPLFVVFSSPSVFQAWEPTYPCEAQFLVD